MKKKAKELTPTEKVAREKLRIEGLAENLEKRFIDVQKLEISLANAKKDVEQYQEEIKAAQNKLREITG